MRPSFKDIDYKPSEANRISFKEWEEQQGLKEEWLTAEHIPVKSVYGESDLQELEHLEYAAGLPPFLRGPYSTMYVIIPIPENLPDQPRLGQIK